VAIVPNPIDLDRIDRLAAAAPPAWKSGRFHVVSVGRFQEQKGYRYLLEAVEELVHRRRWANLQLHLLGQGPLENELRSFVAERRLEDYIRFEGFQANPFVFLRHAHLFCLASLYEGMPHVLLEAMACQVPVLATDCPSGPREALEGGRHGRLVPPGDVQALAGALEDAREHYDDWRRRVPAARRHIEQHYAIRVQIRAIETILKDAALRRKSGLQIGR
jgi:glycosyltransferase involved in cell wall biosynthesis